MKLNSILKGEGKKMKLFGMVVSAVVLLVVITVWQLGFFTKLTFITEKLGPYKIVYVDHKGPYHKIGDKFTLVKSFLDTNKITYSESLGEYYDDPGKTKVEELKSIAGYVVDMKTKLPKLAEPYKTKIIAKNSYVTTVFKGSPAVGPIIVYPKAMKFIDESGNKISGPALELYTMEKNKIITKYLFQVSKK